MEAAGTGDEGSFAPGAMDRLRHELREQRPTIVAEDRRYSLRLGVEATTEAEALFSASARWREAIRSLGLPAWPLARAEVVSAEEFERSQGPAAERQARALPGATGVPSDQLADDLLARALRDSLTGLVNRDLFADRLRSALAEDGAAGDGWGVLLFDLDRFGAVNRSEGAAVGDRVLAVLASRISLVREHALVARFGGDEFAILVKAAEPGDADQVATRLLSVIRAPVELGGRRIAVTASVGAASSAEMRYPDDVIREAAMAMCIAKADGGDCVRRFDAGVSVDVRRLEFNTDPAPDRLANVLLMERAALAANECETLEEAASIVLQQVCAHTGWPVGHLSLISSNSGRAEPTTIWHIRGPGNFEPFRRACEARSLAMGAGLAGRVLQTGQLAGIADIATEPTFPPDVVSAAAAVGIKAAVAFPILVGCDVVAVLEFYCSGRRRVYDALREMMRGVCAQLGRVAERSRAQAALARSEEKYRTLADSVPVLMWMAGLDGEAIMFNRAWLEFTGRTLEQELSGRGMACIHPDDVDHCFQTYRTGFERREPIEMDYRLRRADGEYRIISGHGNPIGHGDDFQGYVGGGIDVTDRRRAEAEMRDNEARLRALLAASSTMIVLLGADGTLIADYQGTSAGLGYREGSTSGRRGFEFVHPDDLDRSMEAFVATLAQPGVGQPFRCRVRHADGPWRWVEAVATNLLDYPPVQAIVVSAVDITDRKTAEDALAEIARRQREGRDPERLGLWHWDTRIGEAWWSDEMFEILGVGSWTKPEAADFMAAVHPADRARLAEDRGALLSGQPIGVHQYRIIRPNGQTRRVQSHGIVLRDAGGKPAAIFGTLQDVTDTSPSEEPVDHSGAA
ncbi:MAG: PAS domain S-box protein [Actinomycetota bacterium]|nr:PAS domain S-box protein [Actinomycetota bacterium]